MAKGDYIERRLEYKDHIYKTAGQKAAEFVRDYTITLLEDLFIAARPDRARYQAELLVAYDPIIEEVTNGLKNLEQRMGLVSPFMLCNSGNKFNSDWHEKKLPELDDLAIEDKALKHDYRQARFPLPTQTTLTFSRYPLKLGHFNVGDLLGKDQQDYRGYHPPIKMAKYHLTDFLTLRRFRKGIRQLPHAKVIDAFRHEYQQL